MNLRRRTYSVINADLPGEISVTDFFRKHTLITGTLLLTAAGFAVRVLGFFYRIFLSRAIGAEGLGLYNMVHPIYGICFGICAGSIQTAVSRFVAANVREGKRVFYTGLTISLFVSLILTSVILVFAEPIAHSILLEDNCAALLPPMALSVPFSAVHACINGYYYGIRKMKVPAFAQVAEQLIRMAAVFLIAGILLKNGHTLTVELAVAGHLIGEAASCLYSVICFTFFCPQTDSAVRTDLRRTVSLRCLSRAFAAFTETAPPLLALALPLMGNRLILNLLTSAESIWIPSRLCAYGLSSSEAFSVYGVLTGMAMPFILFPSAITNSMAVLLLPAVAEAQAADRNDRIVQTVTVSLRYSLYMGILCIGVFTMFGGVLGTSVFHNASAGTFMEILAWLCPFLYLSTTTGSILNGLGRTRTTFLQNTAALLIRISSVLFGIPRFGILGYLWGMLASDIFLAMTHLWSLSRIAPFRFRVWDMAVKPVLFLAASVGLLLFFDGSFTRAAGLLRLPAFTDAAIRIAFLSLCYGGMLALTHVTRRN